MNPRYPLYIVSKGRWQFARRLTIRALEQMQVPYFVIVEEPEAEAYARVVDRGQVLILDPRFQRDYDACLALGDDESRGSGPARNFAWEHSLAAGHARHWVMDDNIRTFYRLNRNVKIAVWDGIFFRWMEQFADRYENLAMCGPAYESMTPSIQKLNPYVPNTRIYSCNLIQNDLPFRWRGRYNEDTILSLDLLKAGWCTVEFLAFLQDKMTTQRLGGGNMAVIYADGTARKSRMLVEQHPDVARMVWRYNRWHHVVDYRPFRGNRLIKRPDAPPGAEPQHAIRLMRRSQRAEKRLDQSKATL